jgi:alpha-L-fucosidase
LLNVGPQPDGVIQREFQERLRAIGRWLEANGDSIYDTTYGPVQGLPALRTTARGKSIYLHILDWPTSMLEVAGVAPKVVSARLLADGKPLKFRQSEAGLQIDLPAQPPDADVSVIELRTL